MARSNNGTIPYRQVIPAGYEEGTFTLTGVAPLLMNNGAVDRESDEYRAFATLSKKRSKSLDDEARLREMEWLLCLYFDDRLGPFIPAKNVHELLRAAATKYRKGADVQRSLVVVAPRVRLDYEGPRDKPGLWKAGFRYQAMVANAGYNAGRVMRCRPCFEEWSLAVAVAWDPEDLDFDQLQVYANRAQKYGLGDYRPTFGRFAASFERTGRVKDGARMNGSAPLDRSTAQAHRAAVDAIKTAA